MNMIEGHLAIDPPAGVPVWDVDPYDEAILASPAPYWAELRAKGYRTLAQIEDDEDLLALGCTHKLSGKDMIAL